MINIKINNLLLRLPHGCRLDEALAIYGVKEKIYAVAIDGKFIPRIHYAQTSLLDNNSIDIIVPMQGG